MPMFGRLQRTPWRNTCSTAASVGTRAALVLTQPRRRAARPAGLAAGAGAGGHRGSCRTRHGARKVSRLPAVATGAPVQATQVRGGLEAGQQSWVP